MRQSIFAFDLRRYNASFRFNLKEALFLMRPDQKILDRLVNRIVEVANPLRIVLFGSAARGEMRTDSDLDVLVVMPDGTHRLSTALDLYRKTSSLGFPTDIVVTTPSVLEQRKNSIGFIYKTVLAEGRDIYVRAQ